MDTDYPEIRNVLSSIFSIETGLDDEAAHLAYKRALTANEQLRSEIQSALRDPEADWMDLLRNSEYEVFEAESQLDARNFARELLRPG